MSGASALRLALVTASARSLPSLTCGMPVTNESNNTSTLPLTKSGIASAVPRYGMCKINVSDSALKYSVVKCTMVPLPLDA